MLPASTTTAMNSLLDSGKYSDLRIACCGEFWDVHRTVISTASYTFEKIVDKCSENVDSPGVIDLDKYHPKIVEKMLRFIYHGDYDDEREQKNHAGTDLPHETKVETESCKYEISKMLDHPPQEPGRPPWNKDALRVNIEVFVIADHHHLHTLMKHAAKKFEEVVGRLWKTASFAKSIKLFYDSQISELYRRPIRNVIIKAIVKNAPVLLKEKTFRNILSHYGDLAIEVLWTVVKVEDK